MFKNSFQIKNLMKETNKKINGLSTIKKICISPLWNSVLLTVIILIIIYFILIKNNDVEGKQIIKLTIYIFLALLICHYLFDHLISDKYKDLYENKNKYILTDNINNSINEPLPPRISDNKYAGGKYDHIHQNMNKINNNKSDEINDDNINNYQNTIE